jgi:hypothetical protein
MANGLLNKLYIGFEIFQVNNFSTEMLDNWLGFSLIDQGDVYLPVNFYEINMSLNTDVKFFWSSI